MSNEPGDKALFHSLHQVKGIASKLRLNVWTIKQLEDNLKLIKPSQIPLKNIFPCLLIHDTHVSIGVDKNNFSKSKKRYTYKQLYDAVESLGREEHLDEVKKELMLKPNLNSDTLGKDTSFHNTELI
jgi:hypothetical protein